MSSRIVHESFPILASGLSPGITGTRTAVSRHSQIVENVALKEIREFVGCVYLRNAESPTLAKMFG